jgi:hypothetical protein
VGIFWPPLELAQSIWDQIKVKVNNAIGDAIRSVKTESIAKTLNGIITMIQILDKYGDCDEDKSAKRLDVIGQFPFLRQDLKIDTETNTVNPDGVDDKTKLQRIVLEFLPRASLLDVVVRLSYVESSWHGGNNNTDALIAGCNIRLNF